jgi:hypothetical protein
LRYIFFNLILFLLLNGACNRHEVPTEGSVNAKVIDYRIEYLDSKAGTVPTSILPSKMTLLFADHFALNRIDGFLGQFSLSYIANLRTTSVITLLKLFDKKYYYTGRPGELPCGINKMNGLQIQETELTKELSGFNAKKSIVKTENKPDVYIYTANIENIKNPNITTPYYEVNDVLLEFYTSLSVMQMKITALRFYNKEVEWSLFNIPKDYIHISRPEMEKTINELFR